jgi:hypothetical protein
LETISGPYSGSLPLSEALRDLEREVPEILKVARAVGMKVFNIDGVKYRGLHSTNKAGPNGPALFSSPLDLLALRGSSLWGPYCRFLTIIQGGSLLPYLDYLAQTSLSFIKAFDALHGITARIGSFSLGRISKKLEAGGKLRAFAIPTYWVQVALKPLHHGLFNLLASLPTDCTFAQTSGWSDAIAAKGCEYWSADLSAATDRFPVALQEVILAAILREGGDDIVAAREYASLWHRLVKGELWSLRGESEEVRRMVDYAPTLHGVGHEDRTPGYPKDEIPLSFRYSEDLEVEYAVGQPMGAYSSWAMFTVAHHVVVQLCARRAGHRDW